MGSSSALLAAGSFLLPAALSLLTYILLLSTTNCKVLRAAVLYYNPEEEAMHDDPLLTVPEVAARLRLNPETVRRWLRLGKLHGVAMSSDRAGWRIPESEVRRFLEQAGNAAA
jgi:excisionase family DNA binding protein